MGLWSVRLSASWCDLAPPSHHIPQSPLPQSSLHFCASVSMGRRPFGTPEQMEFVRGFLPEMDQAKGETGLKAFYDDKADKFITKWKPKPKPEEIAEAKEDEKEAQRLANKRITGVSCCFGLLHKRALTTICF